MSSKPTSSEVALNQANIDGSELYRASKKEDVGQKLIPLSQTGKHKGKYFAIVDEDDFEWLSRWKWSVLICPHQIYAIRAIQINKENGKRTYQKFLMHREIMNHHGLLDETKLIDHQDRNGLNCQKYNLRNSTDEENKRNAAKKTKSSSKYKGVRKVRYGFDARIQCNKKPVHIKFYKSEIDAALAYNTKAKELHGEFAVLNVVPIPSINHKQYLSHGI